MGIFSFLRFSRYIEKVFGPSVAKFFEDFGLYLLIIFVILILYSWAGLFYSLLKPFRRKTNEVTEDKDKFELTISRSILKKVTSIGLIIIALVMGGFIFSTFQVDCEEVIQDYLNQSFNYLEKVENAATYDNWSLGLAYINEWIELTEVHKSFLSENQSCISSDSRASDINKVKDDLIQLKAIQLQFTANLYR